MWIADYLPFALAALLAAFVCGGIALYAWRRRHAPSIGLFALLMLALTWVSLISAVDYLVSAQALPVKIWLAKLYLLGSTPALLLAFLFAVRYTHQDRRLSRPLTWLLWLPVGVELLLVFSNDWHRLYWPHITTTSALPAASVVFEHGFVTNLLALFGYTLLLAAAALLLASALRAPAIYRSQSTLFVLAVLTPVVTDIVYYLDLGPWRNFDFTPVAFAVSVALLALAIFRYQAVDLTPVAQDTLFENLKDGVLVVNESGLMVSANPAARALLTLTEKRLLGQAVDQLPAPWSAVLAAACRGVDNTQEVELEQLQPKRVIEVTAAALLDRSRHSIGSTVILHDVTGYRALQRSLAQANMELEERVALRTAELSAMRDTLADHVTNLSSHLSALYEVILLGGQALDVGAVRSAALETVMSTLQAEAGFVMQWNPVTRSGEIVALKEISREDAGPLTTLPGDWLFGESIPHTLLDLQQEGVPAGLRLPGMGAALTTCVQRLGAPVAAIGIFWRQPPALSVEAIALFCGLVDQLAILAENARLRRLQNESLVQEERSRLARDLHDSVTQALYALALTAETTANAVRNGSGEQLDSRLLRIAAAARQALSEMRLLLYELRLANPSSLHVTEALQLRLNAVESRAGIEVQMDFDPDLVLPAAWEEDFYWVAMEALNNSLKHAAATRLAVALSCRADAIELVIDDNGVGMAQEQPRTGGLGLHSMHERAARLGGSLTISPSVQGGVAVRLIVPLPQVQPQPQPQPQTEGAQQWTYAEESR